MAAHFDDMNSKKQEKKSNWKNYSSLLVPFDEVKLSKFAESSLSKMCRGVNLQLMLAIVNWDSFISENMLCQVLGQNRMRTKSHTDKIACGHNRMGNEIILVLKLWPT
jgi:hypothetical protein